MSRLSALLLAAATASAAEVAPYTGAPDARPSLEEEDRVWAEGELAEKGLIKSGHVHSDVALSRYLQEVLDRLYPEFAGRVRVRAVNDSGLNAFALPNGAIFFNMGLLARLENEAQVAAILAHEGVHFTHRHAYQQQQSAKSTSGAALVAGMVAGGTGSLVGSLLAVSSMAGYSRDLEREADRQGFALLIRAGYDVRESVKGFRLLADEVRVLDIKEPFFFASHPRLKERIESFEELIAGYDGPPGATGVERFAGVTRGLREEWLMAQIAEGKPKSVIHVLSNPALLARYPVHASFYLGEAYRLRGETGDAEKAAESWQRAVREVPGFAPSYRSLGIQAMKRGDYAAARTHLDRYLALAPDARDAGYVEAYLEDLRERLKP